MHLHDLMGWPGPMTHRQYEVWLQWRWSDIVSPERCETLYTMRVAQALGGGDLTDYQLKPVEEVSADDIATQTAIQKARWGRATGSAK